MRPLISLIFSSLLLSGPATAQHWHDDDDHWKKHAKHEEDRHVFDHRAEGCYFQPGDARVITQGYEPRYRQLPPGLQKKLYRTGHLPPGWEKRMQPLPVAVERQLAQDLSLRVSYAGMNSYRMSQTVDLNQQRPSATPVIERLTDADRRTGET